MALDGALGVLGGEPSEAQIPANVVAQRDADRKRIYDDEISSTSDPSLKARLQQERDSPPSDRRKIVMPDADSGPLSGALSVLAQVDAPADKPLPTAAEQPDGAIANVIKGAAIPLEGAAQIGTSLLATPVAGLAGIAQGIKNLFSPGISAADRVAAVQDALTYQPRSADAAGAVHTLTTPFRRIAETSSDLGGAVSEGTGSPFFGAGVSTVLQSLPAFLAGGVKGLPAKTAEAAPTVAGSVGAASLSKADLARATVQNSSPELQAIVSKVINKGGEVNQAALERHVDAYSLPRPVHLTKGQATADVETLSNEMNARGKNPQLATLYNQQNKDLVENTNLIREQAAPDVFSTSKPEHAEAIADAYKIKDAALRADISAKYKALEDANGGSFPIDAKTFVDQADAALHKQLLFDHVPPAIRSTMDRLKTEGMTFENFETMRTRLAAIQRSQNYAGNVKAAAGTIRDTLESLPMPAGAEGLKPLADAARSAAKSRFDQIEADPAWKAVVTGKAGDNLVDKYVLGADRKDVAQLMKNLSDNPTAQQTVRAAVIDTLKAKSGILDQDKGNFSQAGYNRTLEGVRPKLGLIFEPQTAQQLETLGRVARYTQEQPRGSFVNNSNTFVAAAKEAAKSSAEGAANVAAGGVPVGTWFRKAAQIAEQKKALKETLGAGAGIRLKDVR